MTIFENTDLVRNSKFDQMVDVAKATIKKYELSLMSKSKPPLLITSNEMLSPSRSRLGSTGKKFNSGQYLGRRTRTRENSQPKKLLNNPLTAEMRKSNHSLALPGERLSSGGLRNNSENRLACN